MEVKFNGEKLIHTLLPRTLMEQSIYNYLDIAHFFAYSYKIQPFYLSSSLFTKVQYWPIKSILSQH